MKEFTVCCRGSGCPKIIVIDQKTIKITDDFGGSVLLHPDEVEMIAALVSRETSPEEK